MAILTELPEEQEAAITYDVFLSFRGKDTRLGFMDHLYQALVNENISTFLDEEEVETGEELKPELARAIKSSRASIVVLSKNYASSTWCLDELVMILEQRRVSDHFVLPVFYNVEATHIRKQESTFGEELLKHKQRIESEKDAEKKIQGARKLEMWRKGLTEIADLKGKDATGRRETVFIEELVKEISSRLELHTRTKIPHLIGMDMSILSISSWLKGGSSKSAEILTIWGMAGIGKTTLAKYIYRLHCHEFERSSFVEEIERKCAEQTYVLLDLQKQLLGDILRKRMIEEHDVDACTSKIEKALFNKPTLVVLDGVDNSEQVDVLIGTKGFHPGSKIILTTKDGPLTEKSAIFGIKVPPKHTKHELYGLSATESLRLLCWHAFGQYDPKEGYEEEAIRASKFCGGHPLALKVLGSSLNNEDVATWSDTFEMLETGEFHAHVHKVLQISFDSLPSESCKELFKHIACFFVGKDREVTETILKECGIRTSYGIKKLIDRCLLMIGGRNELRMHQLLQEMGRDLVRKESPEKPWKRSRVWNHGESLNLLKEDKGTGKIQGLVLDMKMLEKEPLRGLSVAGHELEDNDPNMIFGIGPSNHSILKFPSSGCKKIELRTNALRKMDKLNLLQLNHVKLKGSYKNFPEGLRGLCMHGFQLKYVPSDLPMENLVALDMSYSNLTQLWKKPKILVSLKILNLSYCKFVRIGGFPGLPALERLILVGCERLTEVCESIGGCDELAFLDMSYCKELQKIPSSIGKLKKLKVLSINGCIGASAFSSEMKVLNADDISMKTDNSFSSLTNCIPASSKSLLLSLAPSLLSLSLKNNNLRTESFPKDFSSLSKLKELYLDGNPIDSLPDCVRSLIRLDKLSLTGCSKLTSVCCPIISTLRDLRVDDCQSLVKVTFHPGKPPYSCNYLMSDSVTEVEGKIKIQDLAQIDEKILCSLGWTNLQHVKCLDLTIWNSDSWISAKKLPIQMYFEFGIFSTCFPGEELPNWFGNRSPGSSLSFTIPSSPVNKSLQGLNIGFVHMFPGTGRVSVLGIKVRNVTKNRSWTYYGVVFAIQTENGGLVWLSHWMFANNELEAGDEVSINIIDDEEEDVEQDGVIVTECAISPVYTTGDKEEDPLGYYKSWKVMVGEYVPCFEFTIGNYLITRRIKYIYPRGEHGHRWRGIKPMHRARYRYGVLR
ncbi:disease resistance protein RUN1 [Lactuca sativa]|uniref:TIR domain-containing protein n=1 Tax=Lactuca sativa TaxID=4236 RepID=A0A9R1URG1_LACSA|nr:disease resistance protein RUN1 [Lactuca sativa]XP_023763359.1 disease resistance protein RUN1 [Lactuca sativa]KAJ0191787.1 hypothetical protein LSAT_V11C800435170 [Lactuca sativa]